MSYCVIRYSIMSYSNVFDLIISYCIMFHNNLWRRFGLVRYASTKSVQCAMETIMKEEVVVHDFSVVVISLSTNKNIMETTPTIIITCSATEKYEIKYYSFGYYYTTSNYYKS